MLEFTEIDVFYPNLPEFMENLRILHIGDLHILHYGTKEQMIHKIMLEPADILLCSGDACYQFRVANPFYDDKHDEHTLQVGLNKRGLTLAPKIDTATEVFTKLLEDTHFPLGMYFSQGNHDPDEFIKILPDLGFIVLENESRHITIGKNEGFNLCGLKCENRKSADVPKTLIDMDPELFTVGLTHYPELAEALAAGGADLILCGHTHGGQICLPNGRPLSTHSRTGRKYSAGLTRFGHSCIYTIRGTGYSLLHVRLFCPPEIARFTLHRGDSSQTTVTSRKIS
jgi:hypothetical protein